MKIKSKQIGVTVRINGAKYTFWDEPIDVKSDHAKKLLLNPTFVKVGKGESESMDGFDALTSVKGVGKKTIKDLKKIYDNDYDKFYGDIVEGKSIPVDDDIEEKLIEHLKRKIK